MIRETIRSLLRKGSFTQNVAFIGSGKIFISIIGFLLIPILSRIYTPEAYGYFSTYNSVVTLLVTILTFAYPNTMVIIDEEKKFYNITFFLFVNIFFWTVISSTIFIVQYFLPIHFLTGIDKRYIVLIPIGFFINGILQILSQWNIRREKYVLSSTLEMSGGLSARLFSLGFGFLTSGNLSGIILGNQFGRTLSVSINIFKTIKKEYKQFIKAISYVSIIKTLKEYSRYPLYFLPVNISNVLKGQIPVYFIIAKFNESILGNYSMAYSLLNLPIQIIGNSISTVFLRTATNIINSGIDELSKFSNKVLNRIQIFSVIPFSIVFVFGSEIFSFFLGSKWINAGVYASLLSPYLYLMIIFSPLVPLMQVFKREKWLFIFNLISLVLSSLALLIGISTDNVENTILFYSISNIIMYIILGWILLNLINLRVLYFLFKTIISFLVLAAILYWGKSFF